MGYMRHHGILVTAFNEVQAKAAHAMASAHCIAGGHPLVSPLHGEVVNGYWSFAVFPDGSKEGWEASAEGDTGRTALISWLDAQRYEDGSSPFDWVEVQYGDDEEITEVTAHSDEKRRKKVRRG